MPYFFVLRFFRSSSGYEVKPEKISVFRGVEAPARDHGAAFGYEAEPGGYGWKS